MSINFSFDGEFWTTASFSAIIPAIFFCCLFWLIDPEEELLFRILAFWSMANFFNLSFFSCMIFSIFFLDFSVLKYVFRPFFDCVVPTLKGLTLNDLLSFGVVESFHGFMLNGWGSIRIFYLDGDTLKEYNFYLDCLFLKNLRHGLLLCLLVCGCFKI